MLKLDLGTAGTMLLYEVPYIAVPSLPEASKVTNLEINELRDKEEIKVVVKDCYIEDAHFEQIKEPILKGVPHGPFSLKLEREILRPPAPKKAPERRRY